MSALRIRQEQLMSRTGQSGVMTVKKPTLIASLTDGVLTIQGQDQVSGIQSITVNGTEYTDLKDGQLKIQLTQKDFTTKQIEISAKDGSRK